MFKGRDVNVQIGRTARIMMYGFLVNIVAIIVLIVLTSAVTINKLDITSSTLQHQSIAGSSQNQTIKGLLLINYFSPTVLIAIVLLGLASSMVSYMARLSTIRREFKDARRLVRIYMAINIAVIVFSSTYFVPLSTTLSFWTNGLVTNAADSPAIASVLVAVLIVLFLLGVAIMYLGLVSLGRVEDMFRPHRRPGRSPGPPPQ